MCQVQSESNNKYLERFKANVMTPNQLAEKIIYTTIIYAKIHEHWRCYTK